MEDMGSLEDEVVIISKEVSRYGRRVFDCCEIIGIAQFSPSFFVFDSSTQQASVRWG